MNFTFDPVVFLRGIVSKDVIDDYTNNKFVNITKNDLKKIKVERSSVVNVNENISVNKNGSEDMNVVYKINNNFKKCKLCHEEYEEGIGIPSRYLREIKDGKEYYVFIIESDKFGYCSFQCVWDMHCREMEKVFRFRDYKLQQAGDAILILFSILYPGKKLERKLNQNITYPYGPLKKEELNTDKYIYYVTPNVNLIIDTAIVNKVKK